jgi:hypothetical protein
VLSDLEAADEVDEVPTRAGRVLVDYHKVCLANHLVRLPPAVRARASLGDGDFRAVYEEALTLRALAHAKAPDADARRAESDAILGRLGVASLPTVPLPYPAP